MNNLIITTRQSPVRLLVDYVATTILWTLFALFIFLFAMDLLTGYYWQSDAEADFISIFCWQWRMPSC